MCRRGRYKLLCLENPDISMRFHRPFRVKNTSTSQTLIAYRVSSESEPDVEQRDEPTLSHPPDISIPSSLDPGTFSNKARQVAGAVCALSDLRVLPVWKGHAISTRV